MDKVKNAIWFLILTSVVLVPSFRSVDYKSYAVSIAFFLLLFLQAFSFFKKPEISFSPLEIYLTLFVVWICGSYFWSPVDLAASEYLGRFLPCIGIYLIVRQDRRNVDDSIRFFIWMWLSLIVCLYGFVQKVGWGSVFYNSENPSLDRIFSTFGNPNIDAAFLVLSAPVILLTFTINKTNSWKVIFKIIIFVFLFLNIVLTESRAGLLAFIFEFILGIYFLRTVINRFEYWKWILTFLLVLIMGGLIYDFLKIGNRPTQRMELWKSAAHMFLEKPIQGWGIGQFSVNFDSFVTPELLGQMQKDNTFAEHVHNEVLELGIESGLVGLILGSLFWCQLCGRGIRQYLLHSSQQKILEYEKLGLTLGLLGVGLMNLFDYNCRLSGIAFFIWFSSGLLANKVFPTDKVRLSSQLGIFLGVLLLCGVAFGMFQEGRLLIAVIAENPKKEFLSGLPADLLNDKRNILMDLKSHPTNSNDYHELGNIYAKLGKMDDAKIAFEKELELNPQSTGAYLNLGNIYLLSAENDLGHMQMARECYEKVLQLDPRSVDGHFNLAYVYFLHKDLKEALEELEQILKLDPQNAKALDLKRQILP